MKPKVIALDEPTSQLDPQSAADLLRFLVQLNGEWGLTVVLVEHRLERVARYANRILYLEDGRLVLDEPVDQGLAHLDLEDSPPLARLSRTLGWDPMPLTTKEGSIQAGLAKLKVRAPAADRESSQPSEEVPLLRTRDLHFSYDGEDVLAGVNLEVRAGEIVALLGRNGSGKSTLLKCLVGLLEPGQGDIWIQGDNTLGKGVSEICQDVAYLPQNPDDLLFAESVSEELDTTLKNHKIKPSQLTRSPAELLHMLELSDLEDSYPRDLSVGQRQRVALGAVIVPEPLIVMLDEPTRGLDYGAKRGLMDMWNQWRKEGIGLLLVTHDVELVARACDRVLILEEGIIVGDGPTSEVLDSSTIFRPQLSRLFPGSGWLTVTDAVSGFGERLS
jgi:energy-coupling factor transporter ATP-binding protein EcfA2